MAIPRCPDCRQTGTIDITFVASAQPLGTFSLAGVQTKFVVKQTATAYCTHCGFTVGGRLENAELSSDGRTFISGHFVAEPQTPEPERGNPGGKP